MFLLVLAFWGFVLGVPALLIAGTVFLIARTGESASRTARNLPARRPAVKSRWYQ